MFPVTEETKHCLIRVDIPPIIYFEERSNNARSRIYDGIVYEDFHESMCEGYVKFPYNLKIQKKAYVPISAIPDGGVFEVSELFKKRAHEASEIVDNYSFRKSPGWYMFYPLLKYNKLRKQYGVKMSISKNLANEMLADSFYQYGQKDQPVSLLAVITDSKNRQLFWKRADRIFFCNRHSCTDDHSNPNELSWVFKSFDQKGSEIMAKWGIPFVHG